MIQQIRWNLSNSFRENSIVLTTVWPPECQERSKIAIARKKSIYSAEWLTFWHEVVRMLEERHQSQEHAQWYLTAFYIVVMMQQWSQSCCVVASCETAYLHRLGRAKLECQLGHQWHQWQWQWHCKFLFNSSSPHVVWRQKLFLH